MKNIFFIIPLLVFISCGSTIKVPKQLTKEELKERNLVPVNYPYKKTTLEFFHIYIKTTGKIL